MASRNVNDLHPTLANAYIKATALWLDKYPNRPIPMLTATHRSDYEQGELYAQGRTKPGARVTNARPGSSPHNFKPAYAFDIAFKNPNGTLDWSSNMFADFNKLVNQVAVGITWGGNFKSIKDAPHWELTGWQMLSKRRKVYKLEHPYMKDDYIKYIQTAAALYLGEGIEADGIFGPGTEALVKRFQTSKGLKADGIVGEQTLKALCI
ncbi:peptidoglycan-binding protein [Pontibacter beigongshangensis]|uniref:peptidoglycan-binding protein n=1 Tax=Pontibacter beigongshangensis TaxID=2574733 RepID=UPI0016509EBB|nr:peptidoglycan-binding protein [Pontibacter beigongshangensis]